MYDSRLESQRWARKLTKPSYSDCVLGEEEFRPRCPFRAMMAEGMVTVEPVRVLTYRHDDGQGEAQVLTPRGAGEKTPAGAAAPPISP